MRSLTSPTLPPGLIYRSGTLSQMPRAPSPTIDGVETAWMSSTADESLYEPDKAGAKRLKEGPPEAPTEASAEGDGMEAWRMFNANILHTHGHMFKSVLEMIRDRDVGEEVGAVLFQLYRFVAPSRLYSLFLLPFSCSTTVRPLLRPRIPSRVFTYVRCLIIT